MYVAGGARSGDHRRRTRPGTPVSRGMLRRGPSRSLRVGYRCRRGMRLDMRRSAEVVAVGDGVSSVKVGDRVVVPFQMNCGSCCMCRRGVTGSCASLPLMAMYGMTPLAGLDGGGFMADLVLVPYADASCRRRSPRPSICWRSPLCLRTFPTAGALSAPIARSWPTRPCGPPCPRGGPPLDGVYAAAFASAYGAQVDYVDTDQQRLDNGGEARRPCTTGRSRTSRGTRIRSPCTRPRTRRCSPRRCAPRGPTACAPTPASTTRARSRCRCCRCTPAACAS